MSLDVAPSRPVRRPGQGTAPGFVPVPAEAGVHPSAAGHANGHAAAVLEPAGPTGVVVRDALDGNAVRSVDRAASLLLALGESAGDAGVTELARRLGLHKSTASRLLATLQRRGLVEQDEETGRYRLGLVVIRLADRAERSLDLKGIAWSELERLARATRETVSLGVMESDAYLTVAQVDAPSMAPCPDWTGRLAPLHSTASGKVLLAAMAERDVLRITRAGLTRHTERTITTLETLMEELAKIRRRGFATAFSEWVAGTNGIAVPVVDARGRVFASIGVWGPSNRVTPARVAELVTRAREAAAAVTVRLGGPAA